MEADTGYVGKDWHIQTPAAYHCQSENEKDMKSHARHRHEMVNERLKNFDVLSDDFRRSLKNHSSCFRAVSVLTQLNIEHVDALWQVEYYDDL